MSKLWWAKEKDENNGPPPTQAIVSSESGEAKVGFWEAHKRFVLLIAGCAVLMLLARSCAFRSKAEAEKQKQFKQQQTSQFEVGNETDRATALKLYNDQANKGMTPSSFPGQGTPLPQSPTTPTYQPQLTPAQLQALGAGAPLPQGTYDNPNPALPGGTAPSNTSLPSNQRADGVTEKPTHTALIISHRGQETPAGQGQTPLASPVAPPQPVGPMATYVPFPPAVGGPVIPTAETELQGRRDASGNPVVERNKKNPEDAQHDLSAAVGPHYRIREGTVISCTEQLRAVSNYASNLNCFVSINIYSPDGQRLLIPQGSLAIGHSAAITSVQTRRLFVVWEKLIMPDGFTLDYGNAPGLDQSGATGVTGKMDNHFMEVFGVGIGVAALSAAGQVGNFSSSAITVGSQLRSGITNGAADTGAQILNRYLPLPTMTYKEGSEGCIYVPFNWWLPEYKNHAMETGL